MRHLILVCSFLASVTAVAGQQPKAPADMAYVPGGVYTPLYGKGAEPRTVAPFFLDKTPITNGEFLAFVQEHPEWRRSQVSASVADANYLSHWAGDLELGPAVKEMTPVVNVSWFAARAYCQARGKRLPTQDEWEFTARADTEKADAANDPEYLQKILDWYGRPAKEAPGAVCCAEPNIHGVAAMHGYVWEWVDDFNSALVLGDGRGDSATDSQVFCGSGSVNAADVSNYAAFMRYAFRASLKGPYTVSSLGFRGALSLGETAPESPAVASREATRPVVEAAGSVYALSAVWRDQRDNAVRLESLKGQPQVVAMGFTSCQYACPRIAADMHAIEKALGESTEAGFVFVSIDPERDVPEKLRDFARRMDLESERWTLLTAPDSSVRELAVLLENKYQQAAGQFSHMSVIWVLDRNGVVVHRANGLGADPKPILAAIRALQ